MLTPCIQSRSHPFWLSPLWTALQGHLFATDEVVREAVHKCLHYQPKTFFSDGISKLVAGWKKCIKKHGAHITITWAPKTPISVQNKFSIKNITNKPHNSNNDKVKAWITLMVNVLFLIWPTQTDEPANPVKALTANILSVIWQTNDSSSTTTDPSYWFNFHSTNGNSGCERSKRCVLVSTVTMTEQGTEGVSTHGTRSLIIQ